MMKMIAIADEGDAAVSLSRCLLDIARVARCSIPGTLRVSLSLSPSHPRDISRDIALYILGSLYLISISCIRAIASLPTSPIQPHPHQSNLTNPTSSIQPHQSNLTNPTSRIQPHQSNLTSPTSPIQPHQSNLTNLTSPIQPHQSNLINPTSPIQPHQSNLINPTSPIQPHQSNLINPTSPIQPHQSNLILINPNKPWLRALNQCTWTTMQPHPSLPRYYTRVRIPILPKSSTP